MTKQRWRFTGRKWIPRIGDVLTWELTTTRTPIPLIYAITPDDFWDVTP